MNNIQLYKLRIRPVSHFNRLIELIICVHIFSLDWETDLKRKKGEKRRWFVYLKFICKLSFRQMCDDSVDCFDRKRIRICRELVESGSDVKRDTTLSRKIHFLSNIEKARYLRSKQTILHYEILRNTRSNVELRDI